MPLMRIITINLPDAYVDCIEQVHRLGFYPSRSEVVRVAVNAFLKKEMVLNQDLEAAAFEALLKSTGELL